MKRWFHGVREHLIFTPNGRIAFIQQIPGNRHDIQGLYALLKTTFAGHLLGDNAYWPKKLKREQLEAKGIQVTAASRSNWKFQYSKPIEKRLRRYRGGVERRIGLFDKQFNAGRTLCRSAHHFEARRWAKALAHNTSRHVNSTHHLPQESVAHFTRAA